MLGSSQVTVKEFPDPVPAEGQVLVRITASGLCGSELKGYRAEGEREFNGGHEAAGEVVEANGCRLFQPGDRVGLHAVHGCGKCRWCAQGKYTFCPDKVGIGGTHAELVAVPEHTCLALPEGVPDDVGVLLSGDGLGVPYHVGKYLQTRGGEVVAVIGCGPIGLGNILVQNFYGAEVIALDVLESRLALATELGADHVINPEQTDPVEAVRNLTNGMLADKCIEAVGKPETVKLALRLVANAGTVMACGEQGDVPINIGADLIRRDLTLRGSWFFHFYEFHEMVDLHSRGLWAEKLITDHFPLSEAGEAFAKFAAGETGKVILQP
jgi:threonine dehydrogenase-like Zn-dependent dehydrogenase